MRKIIILICSIVLSFGVLSLTGCFDEDTDIILSSEKGSETTVEQFSEGESISDSKSVSETTYTVTFDSDGGTFVAEIHVVSGEKIKEPAAPEKASLEEQYVFEGWYFGDKLWVFEDDIVTENTVLKAKWKLDGKYTIPFIKK